LIFRLKAEATKTEVWRPLGVRCSEWIPVARLWM